MNTDPIWLNDISILIDKDKLKEFIPNKDMTINQKLNSIVRFSIYLSLLLLIFRKNYLYSYIFIFALLITYLPSRPAAVLLSNMKFVLRVVTKASF